MLVCISMLESHRNLAPNDEFARYLRDYVADTLHQPMSLNRWERASGLPGFLSNRYEFFAGHIADQPCLFAADAGNANATPAEINRQLRKVQDSFSGLVIYAARHLNSDRRARLIAAGQPFVIPGNQLYIPQLALDLREHYRARPTRTSDQLTPVAQAVLFYNVLFNCRLRNNDDKRTPSKLAGPLYYSAMSVGRAFDELEEAGLANVTRHGRTKQIHLSSDGRSTITTARQMLRKPAKSTKYIRGPLTIPPMKIAGESALSNTTGMSPPELPVYAMHSGDWASASNANNLAIVDYGHQADAELELWHYRPDVLSNYDIVDPLSLYAQFWDDPNERIAMAAEEALDQVSW